MDTNQNDVYLAPAEYVDSDHPAIEAFVAGMVTLAMSPTEKARRFYDQACRLGHPDACKALARTQVAASR